MSRTKGLKLVWAVALSVALFQFVPLGFFGGIHGKTPSLWQDYLSPWLSRLVTWAPVIAVGVLTGCLARPRRPERLAAVVGGTGAFLILVWQFIGIDITPIIKRTATAVLAGVPLGSMSPQYQYQLPSVVQIASATWTTLWVGGLPAAVACWVGAHYWRSGSWSRFWRGPGGAILKGGLLAGAAGVVISLTRWYGPWNAVAREHIRATAEAAGRAAAPWWGHALVSVGAVAGAATITGLLAPLRPRAALGAFAGSGLMLGAFAVSELLNRLRDPYPTFLRDLYGASYVLIWYAYILVRALACAAVAGVFAGRWRDERTE